jgi:HSP20 family protein
MANETPYHLDRLFANVYDSYVTSTGASHSGYANSWSTTSNKDNYMLEATMVGIGKNNLKVTVIGNALVVEGNPSVKSRYATDFKRSWTLAEDADVSNIDARLENGLLTVTIPKVKPKVRTVDIAVQ